jgi:uncharacterized protein
MALSRRDFLKVAGVTAGSLALGLPVPGAEKGKIATRPFGKTGWRASICACGTAEIPATPEAVRAINALIDGGVNYLDTAPSYTGTRSESALGEILPKRRKEVFVATKTLERGADGAYGEVKQSLGRLKTDHVDLLQIHAVNDMATLEQVLGPNGAVKGLERAKKDGLIRHIGITGHTRPEVILRALELYPFDAILIPISAVDKHLYDFSTDVLPKANKLGIGVVAMKVLKGLERASGGKFEAEPLMLYSMSQPVSTAVIGLRQESEVAPNLKLAQGFRPMKAEEMRELEASVKKHADWGHLWWKRQ